MNAPNSISWADTAPSELSAEEACRQLAFSGGRSTLPAFHLFFDKAPIGVILCDHQGMVLQMNIEFAQRVAELAPREPLHLRDLVACEDRDKVEFLLREIIKSEQAGVRLSMHLANSGREASKWLAWRHVGSCEEQEAVLILAQTGRGDKSAVPTEDLLQAQRWEAIGRLTGGVVHDFNNLLTGVMLYCDLLLSAFDTRDLRRRYAEEIRSAIVPATALVRQLLVFARPQQSDAYPVSFSEIAESMRDLLTRLLGENIVLELSLEPQLGPVKISPSQAQQVLLNLVLNARDALPEGGRIRIETSNAGFQPIDGQVSTLPNPSLPCVLISVTDDGRGMDAETRRHLFEPFFTTKAGKGSGLGLITVQSIVTSRRGLIHFESQPGVGTRAMILLPRAELVETCPSIGRKSGAQVASEIPSPDLEKESVL